MRQVPNYLLVGNGRVARHMAHYLHQLNIPFAHWHRGLPLAELKRALLHATHVLLLISDQAIESFAEEQLRDYSGLAIHFSGSLVSDHVIGAHPLQSFNTGLYTLEQYQQIPFVIDHDAPDFKSLLPGLMNHHVRLNKSKKSKYHALCVLSGNFSCLLWQKLFSSLEDEFHLPKEIAHVYLRQQMQNLLDAPENALTGPLVRGDTQTISRHLRALTGDEFKDVYASFVACYDKMNAEGMA